MDKFEIPTDDLALINEYRQIIHDHEQQLAGVLKALIRREKLEGSWKLEGSALVKVP